MKRSANVVLAVMAATAIGATSYTLMPRGDCSQSQPGVAQSDSCRSSQGSSSHGSSSWSSSRDGTTSSNTHSGSLTQVAATGAERGGFGSFGRSIGGHASGGS